MEAEKTHNSVLQKISYTTVLTFIIVTLLYSAIIKLISTEHVINNFSKWNLLEWKNYIAVSEILICILLVIKRTNIIGVIALTLMLGGAVYTHRQYDEPFYFALSLIVVSWFNYLFIKVRN
jgi:hypothetical protein